MSAPIVQHRPSTLAEQTLAIDIFCDLLASTDPGRTGPIIAEQMRELTGAKAVILMTHPDSCSEHRLLVLSPKRRMREFPVEQLNSFCPRCTPEALPFLVDALPESHPVVHLLKPAGIASFIRIPLELDTDLIGTLVMLDLPEVERLDEVAESAFRLAPIISLALRNSLSREEIQQQAHTLEKQSHELEQRVADQTAELVATNDSLQKARLAALNMMQDAVSAREEAERSLAALQKEVEERKLLQEQLIQAQKMEAIGQLAGGVAHDFNNMLAVIMGRAQLALRKMEPEHPLHASLHEIMQAAERSAALTRQLLGFARKQTAIPKLLDLNATVESMLKMLRRLIGEHLELVWLPASHLPSVFLDPAQVDQILANLCVNARDATPSHGTITLQTGSTHLSSSHSSTHPDLAPGHYVTLTVSDTGSGMPSERLNHIFEPFFTTKEQGKGTGLGLSTVYGIVCQNHGSIEVTSSPGVGTSFRLLFPAHDLQADEDSEETPLPEKAKASFRVFLVEDEPMVLQATQLMLTEFGFEVTVAQSPDEALALADAVLPVDLLITDMVMPGMNGTELAEKFVARVPDLSVLFMSGYTSHALPPASEGSRFHFIQKPFSMKELVHTVQAILAQSSDS